MSLLLTEDQLPALGETSETGDPLAHIRLFHPLAMWTWYILEFDPIDRLCFGLVSGHENELGYFSLDELESIGLADGTLPIERDLFFTPTPLSLIKKQLGMN